jgi:hypothetical protein
MVTPHRDPEPDRDRDGRPESEPDQGSLDETAPLPAPGGEGVTASEGPDDPPNEGEVPSEPER